VRIAINRAYYAAFYSACAALLRKGRQFTKHTSVRAAVNKEFVKTAKLSEDLGRFYNTIFDERGEGDYEVFADFNAKDVALRIDECERFVAAMFQLSALD
jgi:uncharacterized protein (UPF0332 family)